MGEKLYSNNFKKRPISLESLTEVSRSLESHEKIIQASFQRTYSEIEGCIVTVQPG